MSERTIVEVASFRKQHALRKAVEAYRFAVESFSKAGYDVPPEVPAWGNKMARKPIVVMVRCAACGDSFREQVIVSAPIREMAVCPECAGAMGHTGS